ncbi:hypothetical protein GCM10010430_58960 [Kitasatospora cystarginea]|uniref:Uncharacterized protein n=1 Tax=Kitasatospora cystarginea TaxID=58350 RepID=A0ABN3EPW1_9ACTN
MAAGLAGSLPHTLSAGLTAKGVPAADARTSASLPPVGILFAVSLGYTPLRQLLGPQVLGQLPAAGAQTLTGREYFPQLISEPFHQGLIVVFWLAIAMSLVAAAASLARGRVRIPRPAAEAVHSAGDAPAERIITSAGRACRRAADHAPGRARAGRSRGATGTMSGTPGTPSPAGGPLSPDTIAHLRPAPDISSTIVCVNIFHYKTRDR